jgi:TolA-binding protein
MLYRLGSAYFNVGEWEKSAATLETLLREFAKSELCDSAAFQAGEARLKLNTPGAAVGLFDTACRTRDPLLREQALLRLGETRAATGRWRESAAAYDEFLRAFPKSQWLRRGRLGSGRAYQELKDYDRAISQYREAVSLEAKDALAAEAQFRIGECHAAKGRHNEAVRELIRVGVSYGHPEWTARSLLAIGRALEAGKDMKAAVTQYRELIEKHPDHEAAAAARKRLAELEKQGRR